MPLQGVCEILVVLLTAMLAAGALTAAFNYVFDREWPAVVFLTMAATASVWYGVIRQGFAEAIPHTALSS
jgi:hypothetical protein